MSIAAMRALFLGSIALALVACAAAGTTDPPPRVVVPEQPVQEVAIAPIEPPPPERAPPSLPVPPRPEDQEEAAPLSGAWAATFGHTLKYDEAVRVANAAQSAYAAAAKPLFESDGGLPSATEFQKANSLLDLLNRRYAAVYYAPDATAEQRIETLHDTAHALLRWSERLDELGLAQTPASYRTDGTIALTFEEVVQGPAKRWRSEAIALTNLCVERAKNDKVRTSASSSCAAFQQKYARLSQKTKTPAVKSKAPTECACNPGDPLCSASMSGWCRPKN